MAWLLLLFWISCNTALTGGHCWMESIQLLNICQLQFHSIVYEYLCFSQFLIGLNKAKGSESDCLYTSIVTRNVGVVGVEWWVVCRESECSYTSTMTRRVALVTLWWLLGGGCAVNSVVNPHTCTFKRCCDSLLTATCDAGWVSRFSEVKLTSIKISVISMLPTWSADIVNKF